MNTLLPDMPQWWAKSPQVLGGGVLAGMYALLPSVQAPPLWDPTGSGKFLVFGYCVVVAFFLLVVQKIIRPPAVVRFTRLDAALLALFVFLTINRFALQAPPRFLPGYYQLAGLLALYVLLRQADRVLYGYLCVALVAGAVAQVGYGCLQLYGLAGSNHPLFRLTGSFYNPGPYAGYLATVLPVALALRGPAARTAQPGSSPGAAMARLPWGAQGKSALATAGLLGIVVMLPATLSRAAWLAAGAGALCMLRRRYPRPYFPKRYPRVLAGTALAVVLAAAMGGLYLFKQDSGDGRLFIWKVTQGMIRDNPWVGTGPGGFKAGYMDRQAAYLAALPGEPRPLADNITVAYNEYLQFTAEHGLVGLLLLAGVVAALSTARTRGAGAANEAGKPDIGRAGIIAVGVFSLFSYPSEVLPIQVNLVFFLALLAGRTAPKAVRVPAATRHPVFAGVCRSMTLVAAAVGCALGAARLYAVGEGYRNWKTAFDLYARNQYEESLAAYRRAYPVLDREGDFLTKYGKALSVAGRHREAIGVLRRGEAYQDNSVLQIAMGESYKALGQPRRAEAAYRKACRMVPGQFYPLYLLARLYRDTGQRGQAVRVAEALLAKEERISSRAIAEMKLEMQQLVLYAK